MNTSEPLGVQVPATSANLGPGYDALAVALDLYLVAGTVDRREERVVPEGEGADELPRGEDNLVWRAFVAACEWAGVQVPDVSLRVRNPIPLQRGMGSSAAAAVAGLSLGRAMAAASGAWKGSDADLISLAADLEGHADNAAAAVLGGLCLVAGDLPLRVEPTEALRPVVFVPPVRQSTHEARGLVPETVSVPAAAANAARTAAVFAGLSGSMAWQPQLMLDVLHEPARLAAMRSSGELIERLRAEGIGSCLSGAGPAVLAVVGNPDEAAVDRVAELAPQGWTVLPRQWDRSGARAT